MRFSSLKNSGLHGAVAAAGLVLGLAGACNGDGDSNGAGTCVSGQVNFCPCPGDSAQSPSGTQTCLLDGTYGLCECGAASADGSGSDSDDTDESDSNSGDTSSGGQPDLCGNGIADPGECDLDPDGGLVPCPQDCQSADDSGTDGDTDSDSDDSTGVVDVCAGVPIYVGNVPASPSVWTFPGFGDGFTSGTQACINIGAEGVCTYTQLVEAEAQGDFAAVPAGTTFWVHRIVATLFNGVMIQPDTRARCDDWRYPTNDVNDGEYLTIGAGGVGTFTLDADPNPNGSMDPNGLDCGGQMRAIPCCNVCDG